MSAGVDRTAGAALGALLGGRDSAARDARGRSLLLALIRLHELGALSFDARTSEAVHRARPLDEPGPVVRSGPAKPGDIPSSNRGCSVCILGDES